MENPIRTTQSHPIHTNHLPKIDRISQVGVSNSSGLSILPSDLQGQRTISMVNNDNHNNFSHQAPFQLSGPNNNHGTVNMTQGYSQSTSSHPMGYPEISTPRLSFQSRVGAGSEIAINQKQVQVQRTSSSNHNNNNINNMVNLQPQQQVQQTHHQQSGQGNQNHRASRTHQQPMREIPWNELEIIESLGNGEFGQVFRGTWNGIDVAIKALYREPNKNGDAQAVHDLKKEIDSFRHLNHKRLVSFLGACFEHPHLCFVTEYMANGSLYNFLHVRKVKLPPRHALNMSMQLADGVEYLHSRTPIVVHRDLKSLNVVLDLKFNVKLCDFGLTETLNTSRARHNGGSPRYMAPELFDKKLRITEKIDVWAMACILCEIWGGTIPYDGVKDMPTLTHIMTVQKKSPVIPNCIEIMSMRELIKDCFSFDQEQRCSSRDVCKRLTKIKADMKDKEQRGI